MHWTYEYVESLSLSTLNKTVKYLRIHPPVELMVAGYLGIKYGEDGDVKKQATDKKMAEVFKKINVDSSKKKMKFTSPDILERTKKMFEEQNK